MIQNWATELFKKTARWFYSLIHGDLQYEGGEEEKKSEVENELPISSSSSDEFSFDELGVKPNFKKDLNDRIESLSNTIILLA